MINGGVTTSVTRYDYFNMLNVTEEGVYSCEVFTSSTLGDTRETRTINVTSMLEYWLLYSENVQYITLL